MFDVVVTPSGAFWLVKKGDDNAPLRVISIFEINTPLPNALEMRDALNAYLSIKERRDDSTGIVNPQDVYNEDGSVKEDL